MTRLDTTPLFDVGYDLPDEIAAVVQKLDVDDLDPDLVRDAEEAIRQYAHWSETAYTESGHYVRGDMIGRQEEDRHIAAIRDAVDALVAERKRADTPAYIHINPQGGTMWSVWLIMQSGRRIWCGTMEYGEIDEDGQWEGDLDELARQAREYVRASRKGCRYEIPDDIEVSE